ncbi:MAG: hypothetical protein ABIP55_15120, partial [Tepidisphaeraceae bacterium]
MFLQRADRAHAADSSPAAAPVTAPATAPSAAAATAASTAGPAEPDVTADQVARALVAALTEYDGPAMAALCDGGVMAQRTFGKDLDRCSPDERAELPAKYARYIATILLQSNSVRGSAIGQAGDAIVSGRDLDDPSGATLLVDVE